MLISAALILLPILFALAIILARKSWCCAGIHLGIALSSLGMSVAGLSHLLGDGGEIRWVLPFGLPWLHTHLRLDSLAALFLLVINIPAAIAALYGVGYSAHLHGRGRVAVALPLFLLGLNLTVLADDAFIFLCAWEAMAIGSWLLILADHQSEETRRAAQLYLIMAVLGTLCLLPCFGLMAGPQGDYTFDGMRAMPLSPIASTMVIVLAVVGAGSKAGLIPLHAWLPLAHPAAPSHISALMSGVMTKVALYGLIRILFDLHGHVGWQWGAALMVLGGITAVLGVLYAVFQDEMKVILAYSTVENVGIITIGLGLSLAFKSGGLPHLASLALVASLYHIINHAILKSLLFLSAGSVRCAAGGSRLEQLGGLLNRMPWTGAACLVGCAAMSALPPLNGFVSEWLILQSLFKGPELPHWAMKFGVPVVAALLALAAALAAACFVRLFGIAFLGRPRSESARQATDLPWSMRLPVLVLAALCVLLGIMPVTVTNALSQVASPLLGAPFAVSADLGWPWLAPVSNLRGSYSGTVLVLLGVGLFIIAITVARAVGRSTYRRTIPWDCGYPEDACNTQYGGHSFAQPLRRAFAHTLFRARETVVMPDPDESRPASHRVSMLDPLWVGLYQTTGRWVERLSLWINHLQFLTVRRYLLLMFATLVVLLLVVAVRQQQW